jgi:hypothetical protein
MKFWIFQDKPNKRCCSSRLFIALNAERAMRGKPLFSEGVFARGLGAKRMLSKIGSSERRHEVSTKRQAGEAMSARRHRRHR